MNSTRTNWSLGPFTLWRSRIGDDLGGTASSNNPYTAQIEGASITDKDTGLIFEATIERGDGKPRLTSLTILTTAPNQRIDQALIRRIPVQRIAEQVALHLAKQEGAGMTVFSTAPHPQKHDMPTAEEVAHEWNENNLHSRGEIHAKYEAEGRIVSIYTIDKRLKEARDAKPPLIPPPTTGRPRTPKTSPSTRKPNKRRQADDSKGATK